MCSKWRYPSLIPCNGYFRAFTFKFYSLIWLLVARCLSLSSLYNIYISVYLYSLSICLPSLSVSPLYLSINNFSFINLYASLLCVSISFSIYIFEYIPTLSLSLLFSPTGVDKEKLAASKKLFVEKLAYLKRCSSNYEVWKKTARKLLTQSQIRDCVKLQKLHENIRRFNRGVVKR